MLKSYRTNLYTQNVSIFCTIKRIITYVNVKPIDLMQKCGIMME